MIRSFFAKTFLFFLFIFFNIFFLCSEGLEKNNNENHRFNKNEIKRLTQNYLNGLKAMVANFKQFNPDGSIYHGKLWIKRDKGSNGKMRIDYNNGSRKKILAINHDFFIIEENEEETSYPISSTPAAYILRKKIELDSDVFVREAQLSQNGKYVLVSLGLEPGYDEYEPGTLTIIFSISDTGKGLKNIVMWEVVDMQGNRTSIEIESSSLRVNDNRLVNDNTFIKK